MTTRALEYGEVVEFNSRHGIMLNLKLKDASTSNLILELQARGIDMTSAIQHMQVERQLENTSGKVIR